MTTDEYLDGVEHGGREEQWRLAHGFAGVDCAGVGGAAQQTHGQVRRHVVKTRDLVRARTWARGHHNYTTVNVEKERLHTLNNRSLRLHIYL